MRVRGGVVAVVGINACATDRVFGRGEIAGCLLPAAIALDLYYLLLHAVAEAVHQEPG